MTEYAESPTTMVSAANGIDYAFREVGAGDVPLVLLPHFRGNLDNWDPALIDALAPTAPVVTFDNAGVGSSTGPTPSDIAQMARDAITFLDAMGHDRVSTFWASRSGASSRKRSPSSDRRSCAGWFWPRRR